MKIIFTLHECTFVATNPNNNRYIWNVAVLDYNFWIDW